MSQSDLPPTSLGLLEQLIDPADAAAWARFYAAYRPPLLRWCQRHGVADADAENVVQDVAFTLYEQLASGKFLYDRAKGRFRGWLKAVAGNRLRDLHRARRRHPDHHAAGGTDAHEELLTMASAEADGPGEEKLEALAGRVETATAADVGERNWALFCRTAYEGRPTAEVAAELGMTATAAFQANKRTRDKLREAVHEVLASEPLASWTDD